MKKLLFVLFCLVGLVACGADTAPGEENPQEFCFTDSTGQEICSTEFKEAWYEAFYGDCLSLCAACETMAKDFCGFSRYTKEACIEAIWYEGHSNFSCVSYMNQISSPEQEHCTNTAQDKCGFDIIGRI